MNKSILLSAMLAMFSTSVFADQDQVRIIVKPISNVNLNTSEFKPLSAGYFIRSVDAANAKQMVEYLEQQQLFESVELDSNIFTSTKKPTPVKAIQSVNAMSQVNGDEVLVDEYYQNQLQQVWRAPDDTIKHRGANDIESIYGKTELNEVVRVGVVDSFFVETPDLKFTDGYNFVEGYRGPDFLLPKEEQIKECGYGHGTAVTSLIGAQADGFGIRGIAPNVQLIGANVAKCDVNNGSIQVVDSSDAIRWLAGGDVTGVPKISTPVDIINLSFGSTGLCTGYRADAVKFAIEQGVILIAGSGNENTTDGKFSPANCEGVLAVGANTLGGFKDVFANSGDSIELTARGSKIVSTSSVDLDMDGEFDILEWEGTSFATPIVTGVVALLKQENPDLSNQEVQAILGLSSGRHSKLSEYPNQSEHAINRYSCDNGACGYGILNASKAVQIARSHKNNIAFKLKHSMSGECNIGFYIDALGGKDKVCNSYLLDISDGENRDINNVITELYSFPKGSEPLVSNSVLITESVGIDIKLSEAIDPTQDYGFRMCELEPSFGYLEPSTKRCWSNDLIKLNTNDLKKPQICN